MPTAAPSDLQKLHDLIKDIKFAMLTTCDSQGRLHSRPMAVQQTEGADDLWFFVGLTSPKVEEICRDPKVNVSLAEPNDQRYVSIAGHAEIVRDAAKAAALWSPLYQTWFPRGLQDPNLGLLKVVVQHAEYWDAPTGAMVHLFGTPKTDHKKLSL